MPCYLNLQWHQWCFLLFVQRQIWTEKQWYYRDPRKFFIGPSLEHWTILITNFLSKRQPAFILYLHLIPFLLICYYLLVILLKLWWSPWWRMLRFIHYFFSYTLINHLTDRQEVVFSSEVGTSSVEFVS